MKKFALVCAFLMMMSLAALVYLGLVIAITAVQKRVERRLAQSDRN